MWHVPPQIPPSHNKSEEDGASLSFHLLAAQKAAAAAIITLILILPLLNYASLNLILLTFFFFFPGASGSFGLGRHGGGAQTSERSSEESRCWTAEEVLPLAGLSSSEETPGPSREVPKRFRLPSSPGAWARSPGRDVSRREDDRAFAGIAGMQNQGGKPLKRVNLVKEQEKFSPDSK